MNDRLEIASRVLAGMAVHDLLKAKVASATVSSALAYADELIRQEAITRAKKEAEEHK